MSDTKSGAELNAIAALELGCRHFAPIKDEVLASTSRFATARALPQLHELTHMTICIRVGAAMGLIR